MNKNFSIILVCLVTCAFVVIARCVACIDIKHKAIHRVYRLAQQDHRRILSKPIIIESSRNYCIVHFKGTFGCDSLQDNFEYVLTRSSDSLSNDLYLESVRVIDGIVPRSIVEAHANGYFSSNVGRKLLETTLTSRGFSMMERNGVFVSTSKHWNLYACCLAHNTAFGDRVKFLTSVK